MGIQEHGDLDLRYDLHWDLLDFHAVLLGRSGFSMADRKCRTSRIGATESTKGRPCAGLSSSVMGSFFLENKPYSKGQ